ncbi:MAG: ATP-binding protein [Rhizobiaceae bacterium]
MPGDSPRRPEIAISGGRQDSDCGRPFRRGMRHSLRAGLATCLATAFPVGTRAHAQDMILGQAVSTGEVVQLAVFAGVIGSALFCAIYLIRERGRISRQNADLRAVIADLNANLQRSEGLLNLRDQQIVVWSDKEAKPELLGALPVESGAPEERADFLAFGRWLSPRSAAALDHATAGLRSHGRAFDLVVETHRGAPLEVQGRKNAAHAFLRFVSLSETQRNQARLTLENQRISTDFDNIMGLMDGIDMPFWMRGTDGRLRWVNRAFVRAAEAGTPDAVLRENREILGTQAREEIVRAHHSAPMFSGPVTTVVDGDRHTFHVADFAGDGGSVGIATDISAVEQAKEQVARMASSHADTLDRLTTAVAIFDADEKLRFFNQAFQKLWQLDGKFLESAPDNTLFLDRLRSDGKIAEQPEWREWKEKILSAYRAIEPQEHSWHLPDRRTIRVVANPHPNGGVTWVFENLTEKIDLESRYNIAVRVQGETLDNLAEGVAVFGPDGRARLFNPAFVRLWGLEPNSVGPNTHIAALREVCAKAAAESPWDAFVDAVTGFADERNDLNGQTELRNGQVLRYAVIHLPNGQVMMTFVDVTDSVNVERALKDKNDALQRADQIKNNFLQHVSYELRSPLTNIIGFAELLGLPGSDPLTPKQREYVGHIGSSSSILLTVVNDILDLATVDAGVMQIDIAEMNVAKTMAGAAELVADRLEENKVALAVESGHGPRVMKGDENRIRQILANLLANAANFAPTMSTVRLACRSVEGGTEFSVHDDGPGMPQDMLDLAFGRFEARTNGGRRRGAGLGLAIVKSFVELHGGTVRIETGASQGTTVTCFFPTEPKIGSLRDAAE